MMKALAAAAAILLAGCAAQPKPPLPRLEFSQAEHAPWLAAGAASITGQALRRQRGGGVVTCAGERVLLMPATPYMRSVVRRALGGDTAADGRPPAEAASLLKSTRCDAEGRFRFDGLAPLRWIVATEVTWYSGRYKQGGPIIGEAQAAAEPAVVVLTGD